MGNFLSSFGGGFGNTSFGGFGGFTKIFSSMMQVQQQNAIIQAQADAAAAAYEAQARMNEAQAQILQQQAQTSRLEAQFQADKKKRENRRRLGAIQTKLLASGVTLDGSPTAVLTDQAAQDSLDVLHTLQLGEVDAVNALNRASLQKYQASVNRMKASNTESLASLRQKSILGGF